jgi:hypothetical protein
MRRVTERKAPFNVMLDPEIADALARSSASRNESMSAIVRDALRVHLASELAGA